MKPAYMWIMHAIKSSLFSTLHCDYGNEIQLQPHAAHRTDSKVNFINLVCATKLSCGIMKLWLNISFWIWFGYINSFHWIIYICKTLRPICRIRQMKSMYIQIAKFMGPAWGPHGSCRPQMGPMLAPWTLLAGQVPHCLPHYESRATVPTIVILRLPFRRYWKHHEPVDAYLAQRMGPS